MIRKTLPFGDYCPDKAPHAHDGLIVCNNVFPIANGYAPLPSFVAAANGTLPGVCLGAASFRSSTKLSYTYAGTETGLYGYNNAGWRLLGSGYHASASAMWRFEQFGDRVLATNGADPVQTITIGGTAAKPLAGSPPKMEILTTVRDFVVGGIINGDALTIQWSGINNSEQWLPGNNQSDYNTFAVGGGVTGITGGEYGIVLQENRVTRMTYVGGNLIFQFDEIASNLGCVARRSVCRYESQIFFLSNRGFMQCDGSSVTPIGDEKVDRTFLALTNGKSFGRMTSAVDPIRKLAIWTVPTSVSGTSRTWFIYNFILQKWSTATQPAAFLLGGYSADYTLEDLNAFGSLETLPYSLDDEYWRGGLNQLYVIDDTGTLGTMTGPNGAVTFGFPALELTPGRSSRIRRMRPIINATSGLTISLSGGKRLGDAPVTTAHTALQASGDMPTRRNLRNASIKLDVAAGTPWTYAQGVEIEAEAGAWR